MREQLLGVGGGLGGGVGVREPPACVQQLAQHGRHVLDAIARLPIGNKGRESARLGRPSLRLRRLPSRRGCAPERARPCYVTYSSPLPQAPQQEQERPWPSARAGGLWSGGGVVSEGEPSARVSTSPPLNQLPFGTLPLREGGAELLPRSRLQRGLAQRQRLCEQLGLIGSGEGVDRYLPPWLRGGPIRRRGPIRLRASRRHSRRHSCEP